MRVLLILALCLAAVAAVPSNPQRIVGGSVVDISQHPSIVALLYSSNLVTYSQACGGTILNSRSIVTAAHCTSGDPANRWRTRIGSSFANSGGVVHIISSILNHPSYNSSNFNNDIGIVRTASDMVYTNTSRPGFIAGSNYNLADFQPIWAAGWGATSFGGSASEELRHVQVWTVNQVVCRGYYASIGDTITDNMLCSGWLNVGGHDPCEGDSGGPLYHNDVVVGVRSWGRGCGHPHFPGVSTRVSRYATWIEANA